MSSMVSTRKSRIRSSAWLFFICQMTSYSYSWVWFWADCQTSGRIRRFSAPSTIMMILSRLFPLWIWHKKYKQRFSWGASNNRMLIRAKNTFEPRAGATSTSRRTSEALVSWTTGTNTSTKASTSAAWAGARLRLEHSRSFVMRPFHAGNVKAISASIPSFISTSMRLVPKCLLPIPSPPIAPENPERISAASTSTSTFPPMFDSSPIYEIEIEPSSTFTPAKLGKSTSISPPTSAPNSPPASCRLKLKRWKLC